VRVIVKMGYYILIIGEEVKTKKGGGKN